MREDDVVRICLRTIDESPRILRIDTDISTLKSDVATLKSDVATLESDVATLKVDVMDLKTESRCHGVMLEAMQSDLRKVLEVVVGHSAILKELVAIPAANVRTNDRLDAVEDSLKRHIKNRKVHRAVENPK